MLSQLRDSGDLPEGEASAEPVFPEAAAPKDTLRVILDKKGRKGKTATIIEGFTIGDEAVAEVASALKKSLGCGGSSRGGEILVQGDVREKCTELLRRMGYRVKG